jgi:hypothetical protein
LQRVNGFTAAFAKLCNPNSRRFLACTNTALSMISAKCRGSIVCSARTSAKMPEAFTGKLQKVVSALFGILPAPRGLAMMLLQFAATALPCYASSRSLKSVASSDCDRRSVATCLNGNGSNASRSNDCRPDRICRRHDMIPRRARGRAPAPSMRAATSTAFPSPHPEVLYFQHFAVVLATLS